jgi:hypothetical protein
MSEIYGVFQSLENCRIVTLILAVLFCLAWIQWITDNAEKENRKVAGFAWVQCFFAGFVAFLSGVLVFGGLFFPENAESLLDLLRIRPFLDNLSQFVQHLLLSLIKLLI